MSDDERETNKKMCVCVGRAKSELLVLDLCVEARVTDGKQSQWSVAL